MWKFTLGLLAACLLLPCFASANGYDTYANPLAWSPDGAQLAAIVSQEWPYSCGPAQGELRLYNRFGRPSVILEGQLASPCFSPDGAWLAMVNDGDLIAYNLAEGRAVWLTVRGDVLDCCWASAPGAGQPVRIIFSAGERFYGSEIYSMPFAPDGEAAPELATNTGPDISCFGPSPAPAGGHFLFLHQYGMAYPAGSPAYERLYWLADGPQMEQQLTLPQQRDEDYHESNIAWLDDNTVVFQRGGWGDWRLIRKDLTTGMEIILLADAQQPSLSRDGRFLAFVRREHSAKEDAQFDWEVPPSVWFNELGHRRLQQLSGKNVQAAHPAVSPDGARIAWLEYDGRVVDVHIKRQAVK